MLQGELSQTDGTDHYTQKAVPSSRRLVLARTFQKDYVEKDGRNLLSRRSSVDPEEFSSRWLISKYPEATGHFEVFE